MRGKLMFVAGAAIGFVLGTRAGRERYEDMRTTAKKVMDSPSVHEATGAMQSQASKLYSQSKETISSSNMSERLRHPRAKKDVSDDMLNEHQHMSPNSF